MNSSSIIKNSIRVFEFDVLRVIAVLAVIMLHVSANLVINYEQNSTEFIIGNFFDSISRFAVPFFVMISGHFMLDEKKLMPISKIKNKIAKLVLLLMFWSCFYALIYNFHNFLPAFLYGHYHLWYLYLIIGLYLMISVLRLFVKENNARYVYYCILLGIVFSFFPNLLNAFFAPEKATKLAAMFQVPIGGYLVYYLMGWSFHLNKDLIKRNSVKFLLCFISLITIFCCTQFVHSNYYKAYKIFYNSINIPVLIYSVSLFSLIYSILHKYSEQFCSKFKSFISECSSLTLGVYLIHASFLHLYVSIFKHMHHGILYVLLLFVLTVISSFITAFIISKIKYLKQLIKI